MKRYRHDGRCTGGWRREQRGGVGDWDRCHDSANPIDPSEQAVSVDTRPIQIQLSPTKIRVVKSVELFAGAGGLALGISQAGFSHVAVLERDADSCITLKTNSSRIDWEFEPWPIQQVDVAAVRYSDLGGGVNLVSGGPPCQPFSIGGKHKGYEDSRDMFPEAARAVREMAPEAFVFENVRGLLRKSFARYFEYVVLRLTYPELVKRPGDEWTDHLSRLEKHHTHGRYTGLHYRVVFRLLNAADYGVPQKRERVFIVGFRSDIQLPWSFPETTHSEAALRYSQSVTHEYWKEHKVPKDQRPTFNALSEISDANSSSPRLARWRTVRDAISGLPDPRSREAARWIGHRFQPGARVYVGHTGSALDAPAKTLKAGDHGVPGGENMILCPDGSVRYFTVRESARLQTFPDSYVFPSSWTESMRQIGNAVPVTLASVVSSSIGETIRKHLLGSTISNRDKLAAIQPA